MTSAKRKNVKLRKALKQEPCVVCGSLPSDPCHIKTFKVTQSDHPSNLLSMCRPHHQEQHRIGWGPFLDKHQKALVQIRSMGWEIQEKIGGGVHLFHPEVK